KMSVKFFTGEYFLNAGSSVKPVVSAVERLCPGRLAPKDDWFTLCILIKDNNEKTPDMRLEFCIEITDTALLERTLQSLGFEFQDLSTPPGYER
ncbi:MAG: hypothetical protein II135_02960, partial [Clostridia bacterium]|nr:hypothetical protein [Clostridia bacterium]